jgi:hypothetical protein
MELMKKVWLIIFIPLFLFGCKIDGVITTNGTQVLPGVTVSLSGDENFTTVTDAQGRYSFDNLSGQNYIITPTLEGYVFFPEKKSIKFTIENQHVSEITFYADNTFGLVALYPFDGNANDLSGNENHGNVEEAILSNDRFGNSDRAYLFDGVDDCIKVSDSPDLNITQQITICAWVAPRSQKTQMIVRKGAGVNGGNAAPYALALSGTGDIIFELRTEPELDLIQVRKTGYKTDEWTFVVGTYDGSSINLYVNGTLESSSELTGNLNMNADPLLIGTRLKLPADTFDGAIDEIRIYNRALDISEIENLYNMSNY